MIERAVSADFSVFADLEMASFASFRTDHGLMGCYLETSIDNKTAGRVSSRFVLILRFEILLFAQNDRIC